MVKQDRHYGCGCKGSATVQTTTTTVQTNVPQTNTTQSTVPTVQTSK